MSMYHFEFTADECRVILTALEIAADNRDPADDTTAVNLMDYLETVSGLRHE